MVESRDVKAARRDAEQRARSDGASKEQQRYAGDFAARATARREAEPQYPEVTVVSRDKPPVFARFSATLPAEDLGIPGEHGERFAAIHGDLAISADGGIVVRRLTIEAHNPGEPEFEVTSATLRRIPLAAIRDRALRDLRERPEEFQRAQRFGLQLMTLEQEEAARRAALAAGQPTARPGRAGYGPDHYRHIAIAYLDLLAAGRGRGILNELAASETKRLGRPVPRETVRDWVKGARKRGFLTGAHPGRAGAQPGPNLDPGNQA